MPTLEQRIEEALNSIRPFLNADGGDIRLVEISENMVARLELIGACSTCNMSAMTMKNGVEDAIKKAVPEIIGVEAVQLA